jgi:hypothetical protein
VKPAASEPSSETRALLDRLSAFCLPGGEEAARTVRAVRSTQRGEIRSSPEARWMPFTAEEEIDAARSRFRWDARFARGKLGWIAVTDAYAEGHGWLAVKLGGLIPVKKVTGPDADKGELQRYLASILSCPAALLNHRWLEWTAAGPGALRVRDREDPAGATVDIETGPEGRPLACRADRPRLVGKDAVLTPWSAIPHEFRECEGLRIAQRMEVLWQLPDGPFPYFRSETTELKLLR